MRRSNQYDARWERNMQVRRSLGVTKRQASTDVASSLQGVKIRGLQRRRQLEAFPVDASTQPRASLANLASLFSVGKQLVARLLGRKAHGVIGGSQGIGSVNLQVVCICATRTNLRQPGGRVRPLNNRKAARQQGDV